MEKYVNFTLGTLFVVRTIMEINLKIKVFMKVGTNDGIYEKDADVSSNHFLSQFFSGSIQRNFKIFGFS